MPRTQTGQSFKVWLCYGFGDSKKSYKNNIPLFSVCNQTFKGFNVGSTWTTALWWTLGDMRGGNIVPTDLSYGLEHLPLMSLQHSQWNQSGFIHSATALVWRITLPCHLHTLMPPRENYTLCLPRHSSTTCQIVREHSRYIRIWKRNIMKWYNKCKQK